MTGEDINFTPGIQEQLETMQQKHARDVIESGMLRRMALVDQRMDDTLLRDGFPIPLRSTYNDVATFFLGLRFKNAAGDTKVKYFEVGKQLNGSINLPNENLGVIDQDMILLDSLFSEAQAFKTEIAPSYSLEYGLIE